MLTPTAARRRPRVSRLFRKPSRQLAPPARDATTSSQPLRPLRRPRLFARSLLGRPRRLRRPRPSARARTAAHARAAMGQPPASVNFYIRDANGELPSLLLRPWSRPDPSPTPRRPLRRLTFAGEAAPRRPEAPPSLSSRSRAAGDLRLRSRTLPTLRTRSKRDLAPYTLPRREFFKDRISARSYFHSYAS